MKFYLTIFFTLSLGIAYSQLGCIELRDAGNDQLDAVFVVEQLGTSQTVFSGQITVRWSGPGFVSGFSGAAPFVWTNGTPPQPNTLRFILNSSSISLDFSQLGDTPLGTFSISSSDGTFDIDLEAQLLGGFPFVRDLASASGCTTEISFILPVTLTQFRAFPQDDQTTRLAWSTSSETNNDYFDVEYSVDGKDFIKIGRRTGAGTTTTPQDYSFVHESPIAGVNYYRLKQVDFDGDFEYSDIEVVNFGQIEASEMLLYPNPARDVLTIRSSKLTEQQVDMEIYNTNGELVLQRNYEAFEASQQIGIRNLPAGQYFLQMRTNEEVFTERFTISK